MGFIGIGQPISVRPNLVRVQKPLGDPVPNGDGGFTQGWIDATPPTWYVAIEDAPGAREAVMAGTTITPATRLLRGEHRSDITTQSRILLGTRTFHVTGFSNRQNRDVDLELVCVEILS